MRGCSLGASLAMLAGSSVALAQPTIDGQKDASYGAAKWLQSQRTTFGDNRADLCTSIGDKVTFAINQANRAGVTGGTGVFDNTPTSTDPNYLAALAVTTGFEIRIPLSQLGNPAGAIRLAGFINNNGGNYLSNQAIGGYAFAPGGTRSNLGGDMNSGFTGSLGGVDLTNATQCPGNQFITIPSNAGTDCTLAAPIIDGTLDAAFYGSALWVQNVQTGFGDQTDFPSTAYNGGSEIDAVYAKICRVNLGTGDGLQDYLFLFVTGNVGTDNNYNGNRLQLFFDSGIAGGVNELTGTLPPAGGLGGSVGLKFDTGFSANYFMSLVAGYDDSVTGFRVRAAYAKLGAGGAGGNVGTGPETTQIVGVGTLCPPDQVLSLGSEIDGLYSYVDRTNQKLYLMFTGNLKESNFISLYFDVNGNPTGDEGQNTLHGTASGMVFGQRRNVNIGLAPEGGAVNRTGYASPALPGLTFDAGFYADYFLNTHIEGGNRHAVDAVVIRTGGRAEAANGNALDYGSYQGANIPTTLGWDGTNFNNPFPGGIEAQDGNVLDLFSHYPPRESARVLQGYRDQNAGAFPPATVAGANPVWSDWLGATTNGNPVAPPALRPRAGLIQARIDNSNVVGVRDDNDSGAATAVYGFEVAISLEELGYTPRSRIRVAGFLNSENYDVISNQTLGDPAQATNLGEPRLVNFASVAGNQYVVVSSCVADFNDDGTVAVSDIFAFLTAWFGGNQAADVNGGGISVGDIFAFLTLWFQGPCIGG